MQTKIKPRQKQQHGREARLHGVRKSAWADIIGKKTSSYCSESIDPAPPGKMAHFVLGGGRRKFSPWKYLYFFCPPKKYMKNICCYYFSSQHDAFWFFLTFLTLKNNLKRLNTKRQKNALFWRRFCTEFFLGGAGEDLTIFPGGQEAMDSLATVSLCPHTSVSNKNNNSNTFFFSNLFFRIILKTQSGV